MSEYNQKLPVTVDKSHIITIGERLYSQSIELIRELVNNAYDADATLVDVTITDEYVKVEDNGMGMDLEGLKQYFNIGSQEKLYNSKSPKFNRDRIGQFGIGKFASLSACGSFEVYTQCGNFSAKVIFDKAKWQMDTSTWELPMEICKPDTIRGDGTIVTLYNLTRKFDIKDVEQKIIESVPLKADNFKVRVNSYPITVLSHSGYRMPFMHGTEFGPVYGEIIIVPSSKASTENLGIEVKVKQVTISRQFFGMESWGKIISRIKGEVNADFLPITSDRTGFIIDSNEYKEFCKLMEGTVMSELKQIVGRLTSQRENRRASKALKEALERIHRALCLNPDYSPFGVIPYADREFEGSGEPAVIKPKKEPEEIEDEIITPQQLPKPQDREDEVTEETLPPMPKEKLPTVKKLSPNAITKRLKFGDSGISCCIDNFGEDGQECFTEGTIIYINKDHPLYKQQTKNKNTYIMHLTRLLTQEISMMKSPHSPREAYERQSKLLKDAFIVEGK